jgi:methylase of polypeptide subunit release factors
MPGLKPADADTVLGNDATGGLGELRLVHPPATFPVTPASRVALEAIGTHQRLLSGTGLDWGTGSGILAIAAARIAGVTAVYGLDIVPPNIDAARENARLNGAAAKTQFMHADSFSPVEAADQVTLAGLHGRIQFVLANPPSSPGDDGFEFRRRVLREAREFLVPGGVVFLNISAQYGRQRIAHLTSDAPGFIHAGLLATTGRVPFNLGRPDLLECLRAYAREEHRGGLLYEFTLPGRPEHELVTGEAALAYYERTGENPLSRWQAHLFEFRRDSVDPAKYAGPAGDGRPAHQRIAQPG